MKKNPRVLLASALLALCPFAYLQSAEPATTGQITLSSSTVDTIYTIGVVKEEDTDFIDQTATGANPTWYWNKQANGVVHPLMALDAEGRLAFFNPADPLNPVILIDPTGIVPSILIGGQRVLVEDSASTAGGVASVSPGLSLGKTPDSGNLMLMSGAGTNGYEAGSGASANGVSATAIGHSAKAAGDYASAYGYNSVATAANAITVGANASATGTYAYAIGAHAKASGDYSLAWGTYSESAALFAIAIGHDTHAKGTNSQAIGTWATTTGNEALALGPGTIAKARQIALGMYNREEEASTFFMLANGAGKNDRSNALTVTQEGKMTILHKGYQVPTPQTPSPSQPETLEVRGKSRFNGPLILAQPAGDIPMGNFTASPTN